MERVDRQLLAWCSCRITPSIVCDFLYWFKYITNRQPININQHASGRERWGKQTLLYMLRELSFRMYTEYVQTYVIFPPVMWLDRLDSRLMIETIS